jgi:hypothetical protein
MSIQRDDLSRDPRFDVARIDFLGRIDALRLEKTPHPSPLPVGEYANGESGQIPLAAPRGGTGLLAQPRDSRVRAEVVTGLRRDG